MIWAKKKFPSVTCRCWTKFVSTLAQSLWKLKSWNLAPVVFWANLMYLILRILKFWILRVPPIQISIKRSTHSSKIWLCVARKIKISECQSIRDMWQVYTCPTCASDFFIYIIAYLLVCDKFITSLNVLEVVSNKIFEFHKSKFFDSSHQQSSMIHKINISQLNSTVYVSKKLTLKFPNL
jgi:hypothetical protein